MCVSHRTRKYGESKANQLFGLSLLYNEITFRTVIGHDSGAVQGGISRAGKDYRL